MDKATFVDYAKIFDKKLKSIEYAENLLGIDLTVGPFGDIIDDFAEILIIAVNPNLEKPSFDFFAESFWGTLYQGKNVEATDEDWNKLYDKILNDEVDMEYIKRYY